MSLKYLKTHIKADHPSKPDPSSTTKLYQCYKCGCRAETLNDMKDHIRMAHRYDGLPSIIKGENSEVLDGLDTEMQAGYVSNVDEDSDDDSEDNGDSDSHSEPQKDDESGQFVDQNSSYRCKLCHFAYTTMGKLKNHIKNEHEKVNTRCEYCDKSFVDLQTHVDRVHKKLKNFECQECGKTFFRLPEFKDHNNIVHKNFKPFQCNLCPFKAINNGKLNYHHKIVHRNIRSHPCDRCDKIFKTPYSLKRHVQVVHEGMKQYQCNMCPYKAAKQDSLNNHLVTVHKLKYKLQKKW